MARAIVLEITAGTCGESNLVTSNVKPKLNNTSRQYVNACGIKTL